MPKAIMEFNLPEEKDEHTLAMKGWDFWNCCYSLDQKCRDFLKYGHNFKSPDEVLEFVRDFIRENVDIWCVE